MVYETCNRKSIISLRDDCHHEDIRSNSILSSSLLRLSTVMIACPLVYNTNTNTITYTEKP